MLESLLLSSTPFAVTIPGIRTSAGEILRDIVVPGIAKADRVLAIVDRPNANVAFELGLALGLGKLVGLVHYRKDRPEWLAEPPFTNSLVSWIDRASSLERAIQDDQLWWRVANQNPAGTATVPDSTLFLCPERFEGEGCRRIQQARWPSWLRVPTYRYGFHDLAPLVANTARVIWTVTQFAEDADTRDGVENACNAVIAGWFLASVINRVGEFHPIKWDVIRERLVVLRSREARPVVDVAVLERRFDDLNQFTERLQESEGQGFGRDTGVVSAPAPTLSAKTSKPELIEVSLERAVQLSDSTDVGLSLLALVVPWSHACEHMLRAIQEVLPELPPGTSATFVRVSDVEASFGHFGVRQFPTLVVRSHGETRDMIVGRCSAATLKQKLLAVAFP